MLKKLELPLYLYNHLFMNCYSKGKIIIRGTQQLFSVKYLFGKSNIA